MVLQMNKIEKRFGEVIVLKDFSLKVNEKEILCIIGPSGCGKSTMLNIVSGCLSPSKGNLVNKSKNISYVFQEDRLLSWKTVYENIYIVNKKASKEHMKLLIEQVGLTGFENYYPLKLSGGMRQRCAIARAFNYEADLLLMDEPFKSLDYNLRFSMIEHLLNLWEMKKNSIIFVTHEIDEALLLGDRILVLSNRPTKVIKEFEIKKLKRKRSLRDEILMRIRNEIVSCLVKQ
ncbi:ABC transporter ATP-binding protein [Crassaminicella indica]|uniref:ABC transporter ATP-binding protein n=1 Tax=Crassaminicella indica TaxID=2855394 RepID=A0ABX8REF3_9CLOT|nr:ABC transporter ATP-binding protein [Crassaminicella indica]QXM05331.1 ABC transporter ATP-binding protein [Crassaminicella indica]